MSDTTGLNEDALVAASIKAFKAGRAVGYAEGVKACRRQLKILPLETPEEQERLAEKPPRNPVEDDLRSIVLRNLLRSGI
jgi:hypothetical protein